MMKFLPSTLALAAAVLACSLGHAQSSVTIYGVADVSVEHLTNVGADADRLTRVPGLTGSLPSRLGFRGTEDMGGGLKAIFVLEQGIGLDVGTLNQGGRGFGRQAFVGLSGPWGSVTFGRQYSMLFYSQLDADILGSNAFGSGSLDSYLPNARVDNAIAYRGTFSGFTLGGTFSLGRDAVNAGPSPAGTNCGGENAADEKQCRQWSALAKYDAAAWGLALAVDELRGGPAAFAGLTASTLTDRRSTAAGWARFGAVKLGAGIIRRKNEGSAATPRSDLWYVGAAWNITPLLVIEPQIFKLDFKSSANEATLLGLRAMYSLSKRTAVYATAGRIDNDGTLAISVSNAAAGGAPAAGRTQKGLAAGIRHSF